MHVSEPLEIEPACLLSIGYYLAEDDEIINNNSSIHTIDSIGDDDGPPCFFSQWSLSATNV